MSSKVDLTYKSEEKGILDKKTFFYTIKKTFFYTIKKTYEREREEEKQMEWNLVGQIVFQCII